MAGERRASNPRLRCKSSKSKGPVLGTANASSCSVLPITKIAIGWLVGLWIGAALEVPPSLSLPLLGLCACGLHGIARTPGHHTLGPFHVVHWGPPLFAIGAGLLTPMENPAGSEDTEIPSGLARLTVYVNNTSMAHDGAHIADVEVQSGHLLSGERFRLGTRLRLTPEPLPEGAVVSVLAQITPTTAYRNLTPHPPWIAPDPLAGWGRLPGPSAYKVTLAPNALRDVIGGNRRRLRTALLRSLPKDCSGLALALLLGDRNAISPEQRSEVNAAGLSHVLAVSGLHISVMAGLAMLCVRRCLIRLSLLSARYDCLRVAYGLSAPMALLIGEFCGGGPSATRAATTAAISWALRFMGLRPTATTTTACAILCIGTTDPQLVVTPGFTLSIVATAAVLQGFDRTNANSPSPLGFLSSSVRMSVLTMAVTAPVTLWCFEQIPLSGVIANIIAIPWASLVLIPAAVQHGVFLAICPTLGSVSAPIFVLSARVLFGISKSAASWAPSIPWPVPSLWQGILLGALAATFLLPRNVQRRSRILLIGSLISGLLCAEVYLRHSEQPQGELRITFLDVGQGDAAIIDMPDGSLVLVDAGGDPQGYRDPGKRVILPLLKARRRGHIDLAILSHPHPDHYGGFPTLLQALPIRELWDSGQAEQEVDIFPSPNPVIDMLTDARRRNIPVRYPNTLCNQPKRFGAASLTILHPCPAVDHGLSENDNSLVALLEFKSTRILFSGDIESESEARLVNEHRIRNIDILKVGHHGSRTSSTSAFLRHLSPRLAVISAGRNNRFGHPHPEVTSRLRNMGIPAINIRRQGSVELRSDGTRIRWKTWSGDGGTLESDGASQPTQDLKSQKDKP